MAVGRTRLAGVLAPILFFVGVLLVGLAIALPTLVGGAIKKVPSDTDTTITARSVTSGDDDNPAAPAKLWNPCSVNATEAEVRDADVSAQQRIVSVDPTDTKQVTLQVSGTTTTTKVIKDGKEEQPDIEGMDSFQRACGDGLLNAYRDKVSVDRKTSKPGASEVIVSLGGQAVPLTTREGYTYRLPFDVTTDGTYNYFDLQTRQTLPLDFVEETEIAGVKVYQFHTVATPVDLWTIHDPNGKTLAGTQLEMPASWWGVHGLPETTQPPTEDGGEETTVSGDERRLSMHRFAESTRDVWVDPKSGVIVKQQWKQQEYWASPDANAEPQIKAFRLDALNASFEWDQDTVDEQAQVAKDFGNKTAIFSRILPIALGLLGVLALVGGAATLLMSRGVAGAGKSAGYKPAGTKSAGTKSAGTKSAGGKIGGRFGRGKSAGAASSDAPLAGSGPDDGAGAGYGAGAYGDNSPATEHIELPNQDRQ